jgi:hypothetical protein
VAAVVRPSERGQHDDGMEGEKGREAHFWITSA